MKQITESFQYMYSAALRPKKFFTDARDQDRPILGPAVIATICTLLIATALLTITAYFFADRITGDPDLAPFVSPRAGDRAFVNTPSAARRLMFPVFWLASYSFFVAIRFLMAKIFGDKVDARTILTITLYAAFPLLVVASLQGVVNNVFLLTAPATETRLPLVYARVTLSTLAFIAAYLWDAWICIRGLRVLTGQNAGRALLTWFSPTFAIVFATLFFVFIKTL